MVFENDYEDDADFAFANGEYDNEVSESDFLPDDYQRQEIEIEGQQQ